MDTNGVVGALLHDMATVQTSKERQWAYSRAAAVILGLEAPLESLRTAGGDLPKLPGIGPSSTRVILEVLDTGSSPTVEQTVAASPKRDKVERARTLREHFLSRAEVIAVLGDRRTRGISLADYRGDLQMHSPWSDGREPIEALAAACLTRGYSYMAITDHSHGLASAGGMSIEAMARQHEEIDGINRRLGGRFHVLKAVEANIAADGSLDLEPADLARLDLVVAAPHALLRVAEDQTPRFLRLVDTPGVHILGHPRGRMYGARGGIVADWPAVFRAAARRKVAIELDGDPMRQDLDHTIARHALDAGCLFALDSDAHATSELHYAEYAIAQARLAGIPRTRIVNCWEIEKLRAWAQSLRPR